MWKKIAIAGAIGAAVLGSGAAALAATSGSTPSTGSTASSSTPATGSTAGKHGGAGGGKLSGAKLLKGLRNVEHGSVVTKGKDGPVTHDAIIGVATAVSPTSISVKAADGFTETFAVTSDTAVRVAGTGKSTIASIKVNDNVIVAGTKASTGATAKHIIETK